MDQCDKYGNYDSEHFVVKDYPYDEVAITDTNLFVVKTFRM